VQRLLRVLQERKIDRAAAAYGVAAWLVVQGASIAFPTFGAPAWVLKVLIATAVAGFPLGALWYGPLFGGAWMAATGITKERAQQANKARIYGTALLLNLIISTSLAMFIGPGANLQDGMFAGFMAGFTYVAAAFGITYLFEFRSVTLWAINAGYQVIVFTVMGAILGAWH